LHGLYRHWGHPTVLEDIGCEKVRDIGTQRPIQDMARCYQMAGALKRQFVVSFMNRHGRWPRFATNEGLEGTPLYNLIKTQDKNLNLYSPDYTLLDWGKLRFAKEFDFDYHLDYTELLDDKAISCIRSEIRTVYNRTVLGYTPKKNLPRDGS
jgi:hypothetical protein